MQQLLSAGQGQELQMHPAPGEQQGSLAWMRELREYLCERRCGHDAIGPTFELSGAGVADAVGDLLGQRSETLSKLLQQNLDPLGSSDLFSSGHELALGGLANACVGGAQVLGIVVAHGSDVGN